MKVTITIEDDGEGRIEWGGDAEEPYIKGPQGPYIKGPYIKGPYIKGPSLVIPREDGTETHLDIAALEAAAPKREGASPPPAPGGRPRRPACGWPRRAWRGCSTRAGPRSWG